MKQKSSFVLFTYLLGFRLLEYEQPGSVNPAKHCQVGDNLLQEEEGHPVIERSSYNNLYFPQLRDLWDLLHVYVAPSQASEVAGEGLYVRRKVPRWFCFWVGGFHLVFEV